VISVPEIYKFIKDYSLADLVTQEDHQVEEQNNILLKII